MSTQVCEDIFVKNVPNIPGLIFRGFRGEENYAGMAAVIEGSKTEDDVERTTTVEEIAHSYAHRLRGDDVVPETEDVVTAEVIAWVYREPTPITAGVVDNGVVLQTT